MGPRIIVPGSENFNLELSDHGSDKGGTPVVLAIRKPAEYQLWKIKEVEV